MQRGLAPLNTTKCQAFTFNIAGSRAGESPSSLKESGLQNLYLGFLFLNLRIFDNKFACQPCKHGAMCRKQNSTGIVGHVMGKLWHIVMCLKDYRDGFLSCFKNDVT